MINHKKIELIEKHAELINDELGEYWGTLVSLSHYVDYMGGNGIREAYEKEVDDVCEYIKENVRIKVTNHTYTQKVRDVIFLERDDIKDGDEIEPVEEED